MIKHNNILESLNASPSIALLRARSCYTILDFLTNTFQTSTTVSYENLRNQLSDYLYTNGIDSDEDCDILATDSYDEKAEKYIRKWTENGFLANYRNEDGEIYYELSSHSSKVIDWLEGLNKE